jgi:phage terminase large subunit GpA-like protein
MSRPASNSASLAALCTVVHTGLALMAPPPKLTISQWSDKYVILPRSEASEPGPWRTDRAPYLREMMDCLNDPKVETAVYMVASQLGKTASLMNTAFYFAHNDPSPILLVMPTKEQVESLSKERIAPRIEAAPALATVFAENKSRSAGNTVTNKTFPGGYLAMVGANVPRDLASRSCRVILASEVDGMSASVGVEGDPIGLMTARATNFWNRVKVFESTPTNKGASRIEALEATGDQRRYFVPCPHCDTMQTLEFERLQWPGKDDEKRKRHEVENCYYVCVEGCVIDESDKTAMLRRGQWRKTNLNPEDPKCASFQLSTMYSPWFKWPEMAQEFVKAGKNEKLLKVFTNTRLGRTFEVTGETADDKSLLRRRVVYPARVPAGALVLTCGVDVQGDRIEYEIVGWGEHERSWSIDYGVLRGNPAMPDLWKELDERVLRARYRHASGAMLRIPRVFVDSGNGMHTKRIYWFCRPRKVRGVYACKGQGGPGPIIRPRGQGEARMVSVDTAKEAIYSNLREEDGGTGYCSFPSGYMDEFGLKQPLFVYDKEYFEQLTGEQLVTEMDGMTPVRKWVKKRPRNEALDCRVYAMAALEDLNVDWKKLAKSMGRTRKAVEAYVPNTDEQPIDVEKTEPQRDSRRFGGKSAKRGRKPITMPGIGWVRG